MSFHSVKYLHFYYLFIILAIICICGIGFYKYVPFDQEKLFLELGSSIEMENIGKGRIVEEIKSLGAKDAPKEAMALLENLEKKSTKVNQFIPTDEYKNYQKKIEDVKANLFQVISSPELSSIFLVLSAKINQFRNNVAQNRWKTLMRISKRSADKVHLSRINSPSFFNINKIQRTYKGLHKDIDQMRRVTLASGLEPFDKKSIISNLSKWSTELEMLKKHISRLQDFQNQTRELQSSYNSWYNRVSPEIIRKKIDFEQNSRKLMAVMAFLCLFLIAGVMGGIFLYKRIERDTKKEQEEKMLGTIQNYIIPFKAQLPDGLSSTFGMQLEGLKEYLHKRMSYGLIFQETTPFSALLLDSNLQLIWANNFFYQTWNLKKDQVNESLSWDYLQQFTNLGEDDPIQLALKKSVAGIYNIQIRPLSFEETVPYELYVSPVQSLGQQRVMLFLYPLKSMEESLHHQMKSVVGPITRGMNALINNTYTDEFSRSIEKDFDVAGIGHIFEKVREYYNLVSKEKENLMHEICRLENEVADSYKALNDIRELSSIEIKNNKEKLSFFSSFKKSILDLINKRIESFNIYDKTFYRSKGLFKQQKELIKNISKMNTAFKENTKAFSSILKSRESFKHSECEVNNFKYKFLKTIEVEFFSQRKKRDASILDQNIQKIKNEAKNLDDLLSGFLMAAKRFDLSLSKMEMIFREQKNLDVLNFDAQLKEAGQSLDGDVALVHKINEKAEDLEHYMVDEARKIYDSYCVTGEHLNRIKHCADSHRLHKDEQRLHLSSPSGLHNQAAKEMDSDSTPLTSA